MISQKITLKILILMFPIFLHGQVDVYDEGNDEVLSQVMQAKYNEIKFGPLFNQAGISINYSYMIQKSNTVGYGGGFDWTRYSFSNPYTIASVFARYKMYFSNNRFSPFLASSIGYGIPTSTVDVGQLKASGGLYGDIGGGVRIGSKEPLLEFGFAFRVQKANFEFTRDGIFVLEDILFKRLVVSLGFLF